MPRSLSVPSLLALLALASPPLSSAQGTLPKGLVAHYRASDGLTLGVSGLVSTWADRSGNGLDLTHPKARQHPWRDPFAAAGGPALVFDGDDCLARADGMPTGSYTKLLAVRVDSFESGGVLLGGTGEDALMLPQGKPYLVLAQNGSSLVARTPLAEATFHVITAIYDAPSGQASLRLDGQTVGHGVLPPCADTGFGVGGSKYAGLMLEAAFAEVMVFDRMLGAGEVIEFESELARHHAPGFPEVELERIPRDAQVLLRDAQGLAACVVAGRVVTPGYDAVHVGVLRDGVVVAEEGQPLSYGPEGAPFALSVDLEAGFYDHEVTVALQKGDRSTPVARRSNVCAGDAFLVTGQSNAVAKEWHDEGLGDLQQSHWIRSFGDAQWVQGFGPPIVVYHAEHGKSRHWGLATSLEAHEFATIGQWALRMANLLMNEAGVPIAIVNGGVEASSIKAHVRNDFDPTDPSGLYGRMLFRAREAEIDQGVRALFYYQGEKDGPQPLMWSNAFATLVDDWQEDYPALERIYAFQIREGCNIPNDGVREVQRTLGQTYPEVSVMSTTAVPSHDLCHYYHVGYHQIGNRIARMVLRDLYGVPGTGIDPPQIVRAEWETPAQDALILTFEPAADTILVDPGVAAHTLVDDQPVQTVEAAGANLVRVRLEGQSQAQTVTWRGHQYDGPWITNQEGVGAFTFFLFPITP